MPKLPLFLAGLAATVAWLLYAQWAESSAQTPELLLASAQDRIREGAEQRDFDGALHELGLALETAELRKDLGLIEEILQTRAELYDEVDAFGPAISDFQRLLTEFRPDDDSLELELAQLHLRSGQLDESRVLVNKVLERDAGHAGALVQLGNLHAREGQALLEQADQVLYRSLPESMDDLGRDLARRVASRDNHDPTRVALLQELQDLFGPLSGRDSKLTEDLLRQASLSYRSAREAYTSAMETRPNPQAYAGFLEILAAAGRYREAARFGLAAMAHTAFRNDRLATAALARALARVGDLEEAAMVARETLKKQPPLDETREWALLAYRAGDWATLRTLVKNIERRAPNGAAGEPYLREANFYDGMAQYRTGKSKQGLGHLAKFTRMSDELEEEATPLPGSVPASPDLELDGAEPDWIELPYEGARAEAHLALGGMYRGQRNTPKELEHLRRVTELTDDVPVAVWRRLHSAQEKRSNVDPLKRVRTLTSLLCLDTDKSGQHLSRWHQLGRAALQSQKKDPVDAGGRDLRADGQWYPEGEVEPYELYILAQDHRRAGQPQGALVCLRLLLDEFPGFRPAQDDMIALYVEAGRWEPLGTLLLDRIRRWGSPPRLLELLRSVPDDLLTLEQRLERMRLDPLHSGVYAMTAHLAERGETKRALEALLGKDVERLDATGRVLASEILIQQQQYDRAIDLLFTVQPDDPLYSRATSLRIEASLASEEAELLMAGVRELAEAGGLDAPEVLRVSDSLAAKGHMQAALYLLDRLDATAATRSGRVFLRQAYHHLMAGERDSADEDLERAEAYLEGHAPLLGRVLVAAERGDWKAIPPELTRSRLTPWTPTPLQTIAVLALEDRLEEARTQLDRELQRERTTAKPAHVWLLAAAALSTLQGLAPPGLPFGTADERAEALAFAAGTASHARDAREVFVLLLAAEDDTWRPWVLRRLEALEAGEPWRSGAADVELAAGSENTDSAKGSEGSGLPGRSALYPYLRTLALEQLGDVPAAIEAARDTLRVRREFSAGWEVLERLVLRTVGRKDDPTLLALRQERRTALGQGEENVAEGLLLEAQTLATQGEIDDAIDKAQWALREDRKLLSARVLLARLEVRAGRYRAAQANFQRLFRDLAPDEAQELVPEFARALERFLERGLIQPTEAARDLTGLVRDLPDDPDAALALAQMELRAAGPNTHAGVGRVWRRLEELQGRLDGRSIESISPDALRRWFDFARSLDPRRAERLIREELALDPNSPDLWLMLGESLEAQYRYSEALEWYRALLNLMPEKSVLRRTTGLMALQSDKPKEIEELLYDSIDLHGWRREETIVRAILARSYASAGGENLDTAIELYEELWRERDRFRPDELKVEDIGQEYGEALLHRGLRTDRRRARDVFAEIDPLIVDGPRRDLCRALAHLARYLPVAPPPGPKKAAGAPADGDDGQPAGSQAGARTAPAAGTAQAVTSAAGK